MSVTSLTHDLEALHERLLERVDEAVDTHGLDGESPEVLEAIEAWFGADVRDAYEEWIEVGR